jgi:hypothetical protein
MSCARIKAGETFDTIWVYGDDSGVNLARESLLGFVIASQVRDENDTLFASLHYEILEENDPRRIGELRLWADSTDDWYGQLYIDVKMTKSNVTLITTTLGLYVDKPITHL